MVKKNTCVHVDEEELLLLRAMGIRNFSEFIRDCVVGALEDETKICPHCGSIIDRYKVEANQIGQRLRKKALEQKKLLQDEDALRQEIEEHQRQRRAQIDRATLKVTSKIRGFPKYLPANDSRGDYRHELNRIVKLISDTAGTDITSEDVIESYMRLAVVTAD